MNSKCKILIGILIVGVVLIGGWWGWNSLKGIENPLQKNSCAKKGEMPFSGKNCCEGLISRPNSHPDKTGKCVQTKGQTSCMACGDGTCEGPPMNENKCNCPEDCKGIIIITNKIEYIQGEIVYITIKNNLEQKIMIRDVFNGIEKYENGNWVNIWNSSEYKCSCDSTCYFGEIPELNSYDNMIFEWNQKMWTYCHPEASFFGLKDSTFMLAPRGHYRIFVKTDNEATTYSNEFTIE